MWQGGAANNWTTPANWIPNGVPGLTVNSAVFSGGGNPSVSLSPAVPNTTLNVNQISFTGAVSYNVQLTNGVNMVLNAQGITNQSAVPQTFTIPDSTVHFELANTSTIVGNVIFNTAAHIKFGNTSDAGTQATFNNTSTDFTFDDFSSADRATINNQGSVGFLVAATAGNSVINNSGLVFFFPLATHAANATINNSGAVDFFQLASGDNAKIFSNGGTLNIVNLTSKGTTLGFITGSGLVELGAENLNLVGASDGSTFNSLLSATITGVGGSLTMSSAGSLLTLTGTNTYTGGTFLDAGTVSVFKESNLGDPSGALTFNGGTLETTASFATGRAITLNTAATIINAGSTILTVASSISGSGALIKGGPGELLLIANNSYTGGTTIAAGALQLGNGGTTGSVIGNIVDNGNLIFNRSDNFGFNSVISGNGIVTQSGPGLLTLTNTNSYSGGTVINAGILAISRDNNLGNPSGGLTFNGGALETTSSFVTARAIALDGAGTIVTDGATTLTLAGNISGSGSLIKGGLGELLLVNNNTYTGGTTIASGTLQLGNGGNSGSVIGNIVDNGSLVFNRSDNIAFNGVISGSGILTQLGPGVLTLTGANTYSGGTIIDAGTVSVSSDNNLGAPSGGLIFNGGALENTASFVTGRPITLNNSGTIVDDGSTTLTVAGIIGGGGALIKGGPGELLLINNNTYTGGTTITAGTLQLGNGGNTGSVIGDIVDNGKLVFNRSDYINFNGVISGAGIVTQLGPGGVTLTNTNSYSGGTIIEGGILAVYSDANLGASSGGITFGGGVLETKSTFTTSRSITLDGPGAISVDPSTTLTAGGPISGTGSLSKDGTGTLVLTGFNTYSGGTLLDAGALVVGSSRALGAGNMNVNAGTLSAIGTLAINVGGNYTQLAPGALYLNVTGKNPGQYNTVNIGGNASLNGTLALINFNYVPQAGDRLTLATTGGTVSGRFIRFGNPYTLRPGITAIELLYLRQNVFLQFLNASIPPNIPKVPAFPTSPLSPTTPLGTLIPVIEGLPAENFAASVGGLASLFEISFSGANIQKLNLEDRLDDIRAGSRGFTSNMKINTPPPSEGKEVEGKGVVDGKSSKEVLPAPMAPTPQNRWGVWVTGFGDFVSVDSEADRIGYNFTTGGVSLGVDYRVTDSFVIGAMFNYAHTWDNIQGGEYADVDTGRGGIYATYFVRGFYIDGGAYGGYNSYDTSRPSLGTAKGSTDGEEYSLFASTGYDFHFGQLSIGPVGSIQYTNVYINGFSEQGGFEPLQVHSETKESLRTDLGARMWYVWNVGRIAVVPALKAVWEHEFKYSDLPITANVVGFPGESATYLGPHEGQDSAVINAGVGIQWTPRISTYVNYAGQLGRERYQSNAVLGGIRFSF